MMGRNVTHRFTMELPAVAKVQRQTSVTDSKNVEYTRLPSVMTPPPLTVIVRDGDMSTLEGR